MIQSACARPMSRGSCWMFTNSPRSGCGPGKPAAWIPTTTIPCFLASLICGCRLAASASVTMPSTFKAIAWLKPCCQPTGEPWPSMMVDLPADLLTGLLDGIGPFLRGVVLLRRSQDRRCSCPASGFGAEVGPRQSDCGPANITTSAFTLSMKSSPAAGPTIMKTPAAAMANAEDKRIASMLLLP